MRIKNMAIHDIYFLVAKGGKKRSVFNVPVNTIFCGLYDQTC